MAWAKQCMLGSQEELMPKSRPSKESAGKKADAREFHDEQASDKPSLGSEEIISKSNLLEGLDKVKREKKLVYFSELQGRKIYDSGNNRIGRLFDIAISSGKVFPEVSHLLVRRGHEKRLVEWKYVSDFGKKIVLSIPGSGNLMRDVKDDDVFIGNNILDKQVVDINGLKVIRVNDVALTMVDNRLNVLSIDVGSRSIVRRIGFPWLAQKLKFLDDKPLPWESIEPITRSLDKIHLKVPCAKVADLHPVDIAGLFDELSIHERKIFLKSMKNDKVAKVLLQCKPSIRRSIVRSMRNRRLASILESLPMKDASTILSSVEEHRQELVLGEMSKEFSVKLKEVMSFGSRSIARVISHELITALPSLSISQVLQKIRKLDSQPDSLHYVYVVDEKGLLQGVVSLKHLVTEEPKRKLKEVMISKIYSLSDSDSLEGAKQIMSKYRLLSMPVIDSHGSMKGIVTLHDLVLKLSDKDESVINSHARKTRVSGPSQLGNKVVVGVQGQHLSRKK